MMPSHLKTNGKTGKMLKMNRLFAPKTSNSIDIEQQSTILNDEHLSKLLDGAKRSGQLNLSSRNLAKVPDRVWNLDEEPNVVSSTHGFNTDSVPNFDATDEDCWWTRMSVEKLLISNNDLTVISENIGRLINLTVLDLCYNQICQLPENLGCCVKLERLLLSHNKLINLPESLGKLADLKILIVISNLLEKLPNSLQNCAFLEQLDASNNLLVELPDRFFDGCHRILSLQLSKNKLTHFPRGISWLLQLTSLDVSENQIGPELCSEIGQLTKLRILHANSNRIASVPNLERCFQLKELHLAGNQIHEFEDNLFESTSSLMLLDVRENRLANLPKSLFKLATLEKLHLDNNLLTALPLELALLPKLKTITICNNPIRSIRREILMRGSNELLKYLKSQISPIKSIDESLYFNSKINDVIKSHRCDLSNGQLSVLPDVLLDDLVGKNVHIFDLSNNQLTEFPIRMESLPLVIYKLSRLTAIFAANNFICDIDSESLSTLTFLTDFDVRNNQIRHVPPRLGLCRKLRSLKLEGNGFKVPRSETLAKGAEEILRYLRSRIPD